MQLEYNDSLALGEANHRMKNTLAFLAAALRQDFRACNSEEVRRAIKKFECRVLSFGSLYGLLCIDERKGEVAVGSYFEPLCRALTASILEPLGLRCEVSIDDGFLTSTQCHRLGLMIVELFTNAAKHAFPDHASGLVRFEASCADGCWRCIVSDNGVGRSHLQTGFGDRIINNLARSIGARTVMTSSDGGTSVTVLLPSAGNVCDEVKRGPE